MRIAKQTFEITSPLNEKAAMEAIGTLLSGCVFKELINGKSDKLLLSVEVRAQGADSGEKFFNVEVEGVPYVLASISEQWVSETVVQFRRHKKYGNPAADFKTWVNSGKSTHWTYVRVLDLAELNP